MGMQAGHVSSSLLYPEMDRLPRHIANIWKRQIADMLIGILFLLKYARKIFIGQCNVTGSELGVK